MTDIADCPRCQRQLEPGTYADVELDLCPRCQGMLVARNGMIPLMTKLTRDLMETIDPDGEIEPIPAGEANLPCPRCGSLMERNGYMGTQLVYVDACERCNMTWLDPADLGAMTLLWARTERRIADRQRAQDAAGASSLIDGMLLARSVQRSLLRGFIARIL